MKNKGKGYCLIVFTEKEFDKFRKAKHHHLALIWHLIKLRWMKTIGTWTGSYDLVQDYLEWLEGK